MRQIIITKKTGYQIANPDLSVIILDENKKEFYDNTLIVPVKKFNLPKGTYFLTKGELTELTNPVSYDLALLPPADRLFYPNPRNFPIRYGINKNRCSVIWDEGYILKDMSMKAMPKYIDAFITFHEFGHQYYGSNSEPGTPDYERAESSCDTYAHNCMLRVGFTPWQVMLAENFGLPSDNWKQRKSFLNALIVKNNGQ